MAEAAGLYYELHGAKNAPPLILSSGLGGSADYWKPNLVAFAEHFRVLVYDHRGTGRSDRALPDVVTVEHFADDMLALMDAVGWARTSIVGHAAGGVAGLALALKAPERLDRLVVVNGWAKADPHFLRCFEARLNLLRHSGVEAFLRAQPIFLYPARWISAHTAELDAELPHQVAAFPGVATMEKRIAALAAFDATGRLKGLDDRTLVIVADDDMLVPSSAGELLCGELGRGTFSVLPGGGHACNVTRPDAFNRSALAWLTHTELEE
ncbi:MAG: putative aminoacrylate hydrolase RutD [Sphingomonas bacterium]|uniref:pyrimidine utilization protein D n=1 Tax=Sphingomonas bacterium TaxID=1895847 RepID=UPI00262DC60E|nr:pyrimidine utilization protein D [Sphingomonas bacterium]MDB5694618.1 putative aminoacrylate hydrolase RutD [Sphingomonas bacterium]